MHPLQRTCVNNEAVSEAERSELAESRALSGEDIPRRGEGDKELCRELAPAGEVVPTANEPVQRVVNTGTVAGDHRARELRGRTRHARHVVVGH